MTESKLTISREKEGHIFCGFRFSSSFQKIDMILLTRPEGCLIGRIIFIRSQLCPKAQFFPLGRAMGDRVMLAENTLR